jgi:hypothetical protein
MNFSCPLVILDIDATLKHNKREKQGQDTLRVSGQKKREGSTSGWGEQLPLEEPLVPFSASGAFIDFWVPIDFSLFLNNLFPFVNGQQ